MAVHYIAAPQQPTPESPLRRSRRHLASGQDTPTPTPAVTHRKRPRVLEIQEEDEMPIVAATSTTATTSTPRSTKTRHRPSHIPLPLPFPPHHTSQTNSSHQTTTGPGAPPTPGPTPRAIRAQKRRKLVDESVAEASSSTPSLSPPAQAQGQGETQTQPIPLPNPASISPEPQSQTYAFKTRAGKRKALALASSSIPQVYEDDATSSGSGSDSNTNTNGKGDTRPRALGGLGAKRRRVVRVTTPPTSVTPQSTRVLRTMDPSTSAAPTKQASTIKSSIPISSQKQSHRRPSIPTHAPANLSPSKPLSSTVTANSNANAGSYRYPHPSNSHILTRSSNASNTPHPDLHSNGSSKPEQDANSMNTSSVNSSPKAMQPTRVKDRVTSPRVPRGINASKASRSPQDSNPRRRTRSGGLNDMKESDTEEEAQDKVSGMKKKKRFNGTEEGIQRGIEDIQLKPSKATGVVVDAKELPNDRTKLEKPLRPLVKHVRRRSGRLSGSGIGLIQESETASSAQGDSMHVDSLPATEISITRSSSSSSLSLSPLTPLTPSPSPHSGDVVPSQSAATILEPEVESSHSHSANLREESKSLLSTSTSDNVLTDEAALDENAIGHSEQAVSTTSPGSSSLSTAFAAASLSSPPLAHAPVPAPSPSALPSSSSRMSSSPPSPPSPSTSFLSSGFSTSLSPIKHPRPPPNPFLYAQAQHMALVKTKPSTPSPLGMFVWGPGSPGRMSPMSPRMSPRMAQLGGTHMPGAMGAMEYAGDGYWQQHQDQFGGYQQQQQQAQPSQQGFYQPHVQIQLQPAPQDYSQHQQQTISYDSFGQQHYIPGPVQDSMQLQPQPQVQMSMMQYGSDQMYAQQPQQLQQIPQGGTFMLDPAFQTDSMAWGSQLPQSDPTASMPMPIQLPTTVNIQELALGQSSQSQTPQDSMTMGTMQWYYPSQPEQQQQQGQESYVQQNQGQGHVGVAVGFGQQHQHQQESFGQSDHVQPILETQHQQQDQAIEQVFQSGTTPEGVGVVGFGGLSAEGSAGSAGLTSSSAGFGTSSPSSEEGDQVGGRSSRSPDSGVVGSSSLSATSLPSSSLVPPLTPTHPLHPLSPHVPSSTSSLSSSSSSLSSQSHYTLSLHNALLFLHQSLNRFHEDQELLKEHSGLMVRRQLEDFEREREGRRRAVRRLADCDDGEEREERREEMADGKREHVKASADVTEKAKKTTKPKKWCDVATYSAHKAKGLWVVACKARMYEFARRYSAPLIRDFTECVAKEYHKRKGLKYPGKRRLGLSSSLVPSSPSPPAAYDEYSPDEDWEAGDVTDDGDEFRKEQFFEFELFDDDELMDDDEEARMLADDEDEDDEDDDVDMDLDIMEERKEKSKSASPALEDKENAESEGDVDIVDEPDLDDPSFNPELTMTVKAQHKHSFSEAKSESRAHSPTDHSSRKHVGSATMSTFYVPPLQVRIGAEAASAPASSPSPPASGDQPSSSPSPPSPTCPLSPGSPPSPPSPKVIFVQHPILPLPPPKLSIVRPMALRMWNSDPELAGRGTPSIKALREAWASGPLPSSAFLKGEKEHIYSDIDEDMIIDEAFGEAEAEAESTLVDDDDDFVDDSMTDVDSEGGDIFAPGSSTIYYTNEKEVGDTVGTSSAPAMQDEQPDPMPTLVAPAIEGAILSSSSSSAIPSENAHPVDDTAMSVVVQDTSTTTKGDADTEFGDCVSGCCSTEESKGKMKAGDTLSSTPLVEAPPTGPAASLPQVPASQPLEPSPKQPSSQMHPQSAAASSSSPPHLRKC